MARSADGTFGCPVRMIRMTCGKLPRLKVLGSEEGCRWAKKERERANPFHSAQGREALWEGRRFFNRYWTVVIGHRKKETHHATRGNQGLLVGVGLRLAASLAYLRRGSGPGSNPDCDMERAEFLTSPGLNDLVLHYGLRILRSEELLCGGRKGEAYESIAHAHSVENRWKKTNRPCQATPMFMASLQSTGNGWFA